MAPRSLASPHPNTPTMYPAAAPRPQSTNRGTARTAKKGNNKRRRAPDEDVDVPRGKRRRPPPVEHEFAIEGQLEQPYVNNWQQAPDAPNYWPPTQPLPGQFVYSEYDPSYANSTLNNEGTPYPTSLVPPAAPDQVNNAGLDCSDFFLDDLPQQCIPIEIVTNDEPSPRTTTPPMTPTTDDAIEFDAGTPPPHFTPAEDRPWTRGSPLSIGEIQISGIPIGQIVDIPPNLSREMTERTFLAVYATVCYCIQFQGRRPLSRVPDPEVRPRPEMEVINAGDAPDEKSLKKIRNKERGKEWTRARNAGSATKSRHKKGETRGQSDKIIIAQSAENMDLKLQIVELLAETGRLHADFRPSEYFGNRDSIFNAEYDRPVPDQGWSPRTARREWRYSVFDKVMAAHLDRWERQKEKDTREDMKKKRQKQKKAAEEKTAEEKAKNNTNTMATATATTTAKRPRVRKGKQPAEGQ